MKTLNLSAWRLSWSLAAAVAIGQDASLARAAAADPASAPAAISAPTASPSSPVAGVVDARAAETTPNVAAAGLSKQSSSAEATKARNAETPAGRNIRFQFDGIPYGDVLERFAQMANKPLVADTNLQGNLTFNDPTLYSYEEALDTLNLMLSMKNMALIESDHYLRLVPLKQLPQMPLKIMRGADQTGDVRPGEVVTVLLELKNLDAKEAADSVSSMLSNAGSVAPLSRGHGIIITDRLANIQRVRSLLNMVDTQTVAERQMKAYTLLHASGAVVADLINRTFGVSTAPKRTQLNAQTKQLDTLPPDPNDYVTAVYDDASRTLVLFGPRERITLAEELVSKFEDKDGGNAGDVRIYFPQITKADDLAEMIRQAVPGVAAPNETAAGAATKARLIVDSAQNRLIVAAPIAGQLDVIENLINKVDKPVHGTGSSSLRAETIQVTKVFRPRNSDAVSLAKILSEALAKRVPGGTKLLTANVTVEPTSQSVVVTGSPGDVQTALDVMTQLENGSAFPTPQQTKFIDVGTVAEARRLLPLIEQIYRSQLTDNLGGQSAHAKIIADSETGRLIVTASEEHVGKIERIVKQLKAEKAQAPARRLQILSLKHLRVDAALVSIQNLINERMADKRFEDLPKPLVLGDTPNNRLLITATDEQFNEITQVVQTLDIGPEKGQREMRVIPVQSKSAADLIALTSQLMTQLGEDQANPQAGPKLIPDASGRQIIVLATPQDLERVTNLVYRLDSASANATARQFRGVDLFGRNASELLPLVQQLYQEQLKGLAEPAGGAATLLAEAKNNQIVVSGSEKEIARVESIIRQLDPQGRQGVKDETRVIRLKTALAGELAGLVEKSLAAQARQVKVLVDTRSNSLVLTGESGSVEAASQIIQQLDTSSDVQPRELRLIELKSAEAGTVAPMVTSLFADMIRDQRGPEYKSATKIVPDPAGNRLIVTGSKDELKTVASLVEQLDQLPETAGMARVFQLTMADATSLVSVVSNAMVRFDARNRPIRLVSVAADEKSNSLIVSGSRADLKDAEAIIERLDGEGVDKGRVLKVIAVATDDADSLAALAMKVFTAQNAGRNVANAVSITPEPSGKRVIVLAPATIVTQVETVIASLDVQPEQGARELQPIELNTASAQKILPTVRRIYGEQTQGKSLKPATIYPDGTGTRLLVYGTKDQGAAVRQIVDTMISGPAQPRETRTFDVGRPEDVQRLVPLIQQLYQEQWREKADSDPADAQILGDARTGRLMVTGKPDHIRQIEAILNQINSGKPQADAHETRIFDLTTANAAELANTVRTLYQQEAKNRLGAVAPDLLILPDSSSNRLIVTGETPEVAVVEAIIQKLDKVSAQSGTVRVFKLKYADPAKVLEILGNALSSYDSFGRARRRVGVTLDAKTRSIIVAGDPKELQSLQNAAIIIEQLDNALGQQADRKIKVHTLKQSKVGEIVPKLRQLYNDQLASKPDLAATDILLLEDAPSNQLIVAGSDAQLALVEHILGELQSAQVERGPRETKLIDIGQVDEMQRLLPMVQQLYRERWRDRVAGDPADAQIFADARNARFIVTARTNHIAEIEAIITQLRAGAVEAGARETRIYDLTTATAMELSATVRSLYQEQAKNRPGVRLEDTAILPDASANRLIVTAATNELALVEDIIKKLDKVSAQSASVRVFKVKSAEPEKVREILSAALVSYDPYGRPRQRISVSVDPKSRTIIAAGDPKELQGVSVIIEQLDSSLGGQPERRMKVLPVTVGRAGELLTKVRALYNDQIKGQPELGTTDVLMLEDGASNQLILAGTEKQLKLIDDIAGQLTASALVQESRETRVYELTSTAAQELAVTVRSLYQEAIKGHPSSPASQALLLPDMNANRLIVSATTNDLQLIDDIIQKIDKTQAQTGRTRVFKLKSAEAQQVANILSTALVQIGAYGRMTPRVSVGTDLQNNLLIVSGAPQDLQSAAVIVEQMDTMLAKEPRQMRVLSLKTGLATEVATRVRQLYQDQLKGKVKTSPADAIIIGDDVTSRLIVAAGESHMKLIEDIVGQLQEIGEGSARQLRVFSLQRNSATSIAAMVTQLFNRQVSSQDPSQRLAVSASGDDRTLVLEATGPVLERVQQLVQSLDGEEALGKVELRTYQMPEGNATDLAPTLARLFAERAGPATPSALAPRFEADGGANVLMVAATKEQFTQIDKLIEELKNTARVASEIRTFRLQNGDPTQIADLLQSMLTDADPAQPGQPRGRRMQWRPGIGLTPVADVKSVRVAPARSLNAVVVQGPPEKLALAEKLIQSLDRDEIDGRTVIQTVRLKKAHAENLAEAVNKTISARGPQTRIQRVTVTPVVGPNSLLLNGPADAVQEVMQVIRDLDQESEDEEIKVHIYKLENGNAREVSAVLQQLLQNIVRGQSRLRTTSATGANGPRLVQPSVAVEERSNTLVVSGTQAHFKVVEQLLSTLDKVPERAERDVQFVWLRNAKAMDVSSKLESVFAGRTENDKPVIDADIFNNSITIIGKRADIVQVQDLISRLDESSKDTSMQVRLRPLDRVPVDQMARMLQNIYPQMSSGLIRVVEKIESGSKPDSGAAVPPARPPSNLTNRVAEVAPVVAESKDATGRTVPEVVVAIDKNANALILSGPTHELDQIDHIISELSFSYISSDAEFRVFPLKEADPVIVARTLTELFKPEPVQVQGQQAQPQQRQGEIRIVAQTPKITAVAEPRTRSVIVRAKPTDFTLMDSLIKQLDVAGVSSQLEFRVVALTNAPPQKVLPLVQQMVTQLNIIRPGEPLSVTPDPRSHGLLVVARDAVLKQVEGMIRSLDTQAAFEEAEVLVVALKKASAAQLATIMQAMLRPGAQGEATAEARELQEQIRRLKVKDDQGKEVLLDLTKPIRVMGDPIGGGQGGGNRLILSSTPDNLKALAAVVEMMDTVPVAEGVNVKLVHLQFADAATVSQTLTTIFQQGQRLATGPSGRAEPEGTTGKALVNPLNVAIDSRSNSIILSGQKESLDLAQKVISDLDRKVDRFITEVKLYRLKHASARRLAPLLQSVFAEGPSVPGSEGLATQVTRLRALVPDEKAPTTEQPKTRSALVVQADDTTNVLIVAARTDTLPLIEAVINQLDIPSASGMDNIRVYALNHVDPAVIQKVVNDLHSGPRAAQLRTEDIPNITTDDRTRSLIVSGNQKALAFVEGLIAQLDKALSIELRDIHIVTLANADAGAVADSLQKLLDARVTHKAALGRQEAEALRVLVIPETRSNSLLVTGSKDSFELVDSLAHELDAAPPALSGRIRLIPLAYADARTLSASLLNLFNQRYQSARSPETQRNRPVIVPDPRSNSLLVAAGVDDNQAIDDLVARLDQRLDDPSMVLTVLGLRHNNASTVANTLENIFAARLRSRTAPGQPASPHDQIKVEPDSLNNSLIISASRENLELIANLLQKIDVEPAVAEGVVQTFTLEFADAQRVANMLRSLVQQGLYRPGTGGPRGDTQREAMAITVDARSNTLVVSASPENLGVIKEVIRHIDTKDFAQVGNIRVYNLKHARASGLATVLEQFFRARRATEANATAAERSGAVVVVPDDRVNALLVTGGKESFDAIDRMIQQLDGDDIQARMNFRVFALKQATAAKLQSTLQRLFVNRPSRIKGEPPEPISVVADSWVNALIVGASIDDMGMVASLIERLDSDQSEIGVTVQVFPMAKADARRVAQVVQGLYREGGPGAPFPVVVTADERMNAIIVSAGEADLKRIAELVKKLDTDQVGRVSEIRIFPLVHARADSISSILNAALNAKPIALNDQNPNTASLLQFIARGSDGREIVASALKEGVLITPDSRMNALVVSAPVDYMNLLEQIISRLDFSTPQQAKIKVFTLVNADARLMADLLMTLFRLQPTGQAGTGGQRAIQYTLVRDKAAATEAPAEKPGSPEEVAVASATVGTDEQGALHVTIDHRTNSLLVGGTEHYVALVSEIIQSLDSSEAQERRSEVYRLKNAQATDIAVAIRTFLDQDRQRITQVLGEDAVGTAQRMLDREVAIVAETNSNTLLLSASPRYFGQLTNLIDRLDKPRPQVLIQVLLAEVTLDSTRDLGVEWNITKTVEDAKLGAGTAFGLANQLKSFGGFSAAVTGSDYNFLIRALQNDGRLQILSRPQILTSDNKPANINVGQRVPLISNSGVTPQGGIVNTINYENVGVNLQVTPRIGSDGAVRMEISTTNSALTSSSVEIPAGTEGGTVSMPIINERRASTSVSVQSGQSILIGGLIETMEDDRVKKVPYLGDIPGLGVLFRSKTRVSNRKELLILLTPQVLLMDDEAGRVANVSDMTREQLERSSIRQQIQRDEFRDRLLEPLYPEGLNKSGALQGGETRSNGGLKKKESK
ncbi:MAG: secretin N-terminal domain-containing protein [Verrucomicrobiota bacterium]